MEGLLGALLAGIMVLLFLRDWRTVIVVVLNIPLALCAALVPFRTTFANTNAALLLRGGTDIVVATGMPTRPANAPGLAPLRPPSTSRRRKRG